MSFVKCEKISKSYGQQQVLKDISFSLESGSQVALSGASGSGKSTLLYLLGGLDRADSGSVHVGGLDLSRQADQQLATYRNQSVGFIFQFHFLLSSMNCLDNILLPGRIGGVELAQVEKKVKSMALELGVEHCLYKAPYEISGGEQQRVNIIRALSLSPKLLLCDEPTGNLDTQNSKMVIDLLRRLAAESNSTLLVVTHDRKVSSAIGEEIRIEDGHIIN